MSFGRSFRPFSISTRTTGSSTANYRPLDDQSLFPTTINDVRDICFEPMYTAPIQWIQLGASIVMAVIGLLYTYYGCYSRDECFGYFAVLYFRAIFWIITYITHLILKWKHNRFKVLGYHSFLESTSRHKKLPLEIVSFSNLLILTVHTILLQIGGAKYFLDCSTKGFSTTLVISCYGLLECFILCYIHASYTTQVTVFNSKRLLPDALRTAEFYRTGQHRVNPEDFITHQFAMINRLDEENRHLRDRIQAARASFDVMNSESTHISMAEASFRAV